MHSFQQISNVIFLTENPKIEVSQLYLNLKLSESREFLLILQNLKFPEFHELWRSRRIPLQKTRQSPVARQLPGGEVLIAVASEPPRNSRMGIGKKAGRSGPPAGATGRGASPR